MKTPVVSIGNRRFTNCGAISFTRWPGAVERGRPESAPAQGFDPDQGRLEAREEWRNLVVLELLAKYRSPGTHSCW